ncbi:MAG: anhydro-N-acetylmuramic acid kinase [Lacibacter sp.]|jgi:anhydro-N-acetylmuramic acid kinase|nr:anhydro-N-acetylmuramic acid kinase [Lacibacter sp.]
MIYRALGISGNASTQSLELVFAAFEVNGKKWDVEIRHTASIPYPADLEQRLQTAAVSSAVDYLQLHVDYGHWIGNQVKQFIDEYVLDYQVQLIGLMGYTALHAPEKKLSHALGDAAAVAAISGVNVVSDFRMVDLALNGKAEPVFKLSSTLLPLPADVNQDAFYAAFFALLRWREENNMLAADTGALRDSIGGAVWVGQEW